MSDSSNNHINNKPLVVDLDGTLLQSDLLVESFLGLLKQSFWSVFKIPFWLLKGKMTLKAKIAQLVNLDVSVMPYNDTLLSWLKVEKAKGRTLILSTASNVKYAQQVSDYLGIFDAIQASDSSCNLSGKYKRDLNVKCYGEGGFDYVGNSMADLAVWQVAARTIVVNPEFGVLEKVQETLKIERVFLSDRRRIAYYPKALRVHQWIKNSLIFVPCIAGFYIVNSGVIINIIFAFFSFSLCASSVYCLNDLLDIEDDRHHPTKRKRPFAAGKIPLLHGLFCVPVLLVVSFLLALFLPVDFLIVLSSYFLFTLAYSIYFKQLVFLDVVLLALLYTMRILAGSAALPAANSFWMLAFSMFIFMSLATMKRYTELIVLRKKGGSNKSKGRGYFVEDLELLSSLGGASGYISILVIALYINNAEIAARYQKPELLWLVCPLLLYWVSRTWVVAHRGLMHDDPIVFAMRDKVSWIVLFLSMVLFYSAL